jgi:hypothetical protein
LIAEATPEFCLGTEVISAVVRGATIIIRPLPNTSREGSRST